MPASDGREKVSGNSRGEYFRQFKRNKNSQIPEILDVAVIGIPNDLFGQLPIAFVVPNNEITSTQIINNCSKKLERYKIPIKILFLDEIPKTDSGKIKRNTLRSKFD